VDPVPLHVDQARDASANQPDRRLASAEIGDARDLRFPDESADAVLLLGPLYHLQERDDRIKALSEARRVCRSGGVVIAAAISRFASAVDGLRGGYLTDPAFADIVAGDLHDGRHRNPTGHAAYFTAAYFHRPEELAEECGSASLTHVETVAVEGIGWLLPNLDEWLADNARKRVLLSTLAQLEAEPALMGASAHLLCVARKD
jgi:ubiquinone/menaquinone biosynthesis C-methylase UbiE